MDETKEYSSLDDFKKVEAAFILDTTTFNERKGQKAILKRLENEVQRLTSGKIESLDQNLIEEVSDEASYLNTLAYNIRNFPDYFTLREMTNELHLYYKKINETIKALGDLGAESNKLFPFIAGVADAICACQNYSISRSNDLINRNESKFNSYFYWLNDKNSEADKQTSQMSPADKRILALALTSAWEKPTILFTGDVNHIGENSRLLYGPGPKRHGFQSHLELPPYQLRVYGGFEEGWKLWMNSTCSPASKGESSWARMAQLPILSEK